MRSAASCAFSASPSEAVQEMARVVRRGGRVLVVDFVQHDREWMREELGVEWLGFAEDDLASWFANAGLTEARIDTLPPRGRDLPGTFIASARVA